MERKIQNDIDAFFALLRAGLWEKEVQIEHFEEVDFNRVHKLAQQQSVVGLIAVGIEFVSDLKIPKEIALTIAGETLQIEQRNIAMNDFVAKLFHRIKVEGIRAVLIKGQGIAQCYKRPLTRACGDIDLLLDTIDYQKAKEYFSTIVDSERAEVPYRKHKSYCIESWEVELHGNLRGGILKHVDRELDSIQSASFSENKSRVWSNSGERILLPAIDDDLLYVFTHILQHFFDEGVGIRQICDWCRLLWEYKYEIDHNKLRRRISAMRIESEWLAFAAFAVDYLGVPVGTMPLYSESFKWKRKARRILYTIIESGNFGHNRDLSYKERFPFYVRKIITLFRVSRDAFRRFRIFPIDSISAWYNAVYNGIVCVIKKEY